MDKLKNLKEITEKGRYKYRGFLIKSDTIFGGTGEHEYNEETKEKVELMEAKELGKQYMFFMNQEGDFFFLMNVDIKGAKVSKPFGEFQKFVGDFNRTFDISITRFGRKFKFKTGLEPKQK